jgi:hypothetical protein
MAQDPALIKSKFPWKCSKCGNKIEKGQNIIHYPDLKKAFCLPCGEDDYNTFLNSVEDENSYNHPNQKQTL